MLSKYFADYYLGLTTDKLKEERYLIEELYPEDKWNLVLDRIDSYNRSHKRKIRITKDSFKLVQKIKKDLGIILFPVIFPLHPGWNLRTAGAWTKYLCDEKLRDFGSQDKLKDLLNKKHIIVLYKDELMFEQIK